VAKSQLIDRVLRALPFFCVAAGMLVMLVLRNPLAATGGLILMALGGIALLRRARMRRASAPGDGRLATRMTLDNEDPATQAIVQLAWRTSFECGHPEIDEQHRKLFEIGQALINAALKQKPMADVQLLLDELVSHIQDHFISEEAIMARTRFPLSKEHEQIHLVLLDRTKSLRDRYRDSQVEISELVGFITCDVITEHILHEDRKFAVKEWLPEPA